MLIQYSQRLHVYAETRLAQDISNHINIVLIALI